VKCRGEAYLVACRIEATSKIAETALNYMGNSAFLKVSVSEDFPNLPEQLEGYYRPLSQELETPYQAQTTFKKLTVNS